MDQQLEPFRKEQDNMKANLKKMLGLAALGMTLLTTTIPTWAGLKLTKGVTVINENGIRRAFGSMVGARYSTDTKQNIGCTAYTYQFYSWTACFATNSAGNSLVCGSGDPRWAEMVQGMNDSSYIFFDMAPNGNSGNCLQIDIHNGSSFLK
jgi:hypothetical protein